MNPSSIDLRENQALEIYAALEREGLDREDIEGALVDVRV
jgi:hypothetical protein